MRGGKVTVAKHIVVFITAETPEQARKIADALLSKKLAACVNIVPQVHSLFWWQDKIDSADESLLIVKTEATLLDKVIASVKRNHSYTVPEIIALPIVGGNKDYLHWIDEVTLT
jgi:periplasmic divalent cation tolerance protein